MPPQAHAFESRLTELDRFRGLVSDFISADLHEIEKNRVILALDEAFVNIVTHGYGENHIGSIDLTMEKGPEGFIFVLMDRAPLFDPTKAPAPDLEHAESGKDHGLGIHLYSTIMHAVHSPCSEGGNVLKLSRLVF